MMQEKSINTSTELENSITTIDFAEYLPLQLVKSEVIPSAPARSESAIDWLPNFAGYSWIAYGASSLLVISHFPNPLSDDETLLGPIFRQVFDLSVYGTSTVSAVSWSPETPSVGDVAAALANSICLISFSSDVCKGSFCWSQSEVLVQATKVEAIRWTGSGDSIISVGTEVVLWRRAGKSWGIVWKFQPELSQSLVSATWSIEGPFATASSSRQHLESLSSAEACKRVLVFHSDGKVNYTKVELHHPLPVSMIQWRPLTWKYSKKGARFSVRRVLLTCGMDGTVRLWTEVDDGRSKKIGKDDDKKFMKRSFHVVAVIEVNQELNGSLGSDIFVKWATDIDGTTSACTLGNQYFSGNGNHHGKSGRCEWLIAFGPRMMVTFWAIHCLDDFTPVRFPRVTLWKSQELKGSGEGVGSFLLEKVVILRNGVFGPPSLCSLLQSLPCNSLAWFQLFNQTSNKQDESLNTLQKEDILSCNACGLLNVDGHTGKILQVSVHPFGYEVETAVSLDDDGLLLFWSFSTYFNSIASLPTLNPILKLTGKILPCDSYPKYTSLRWAPVVFNDHLVLFVGHVGGIDCLLTKYSGGEEENILCHKLCTIPFTGLDCIEGPTSIFFIPLTSTCKTDFSFNTFIMLAFWKDVFQALSWKITIHSCDLSGGCVCCGFNIRDTADPYSTFEGKKYWIVVDPWSSVLPDPHLHDQVTSFAVVCPIFSICGREEKFSINEICNGYSAYQMITGDANGNLKLWRCIPAKQLNSSSHWELVGMLATCQGPIVALSQIGCGRKIATVCLVNEPNTSSTLQIWETVKITGAGSYVLEDTIILDGKVTALEWLTTGSGELLLGVCLQNLLQVYARRRCGGHNLLKSLKSSEKDIWFCIAFSHTHHEICDFFWGPRATAVVVHNNYFSLFSQWLFLAPKKYQANVHLESFMDVDCNGDSDKDMLTTICTNPDAMHFKDTETELCAKKCLHERSIKVKTKTDVPLSIIGAISQEKWYLGERIGFWSILEVSENLCGSLPVYHPEALLINICSGKWERAYVAVQHLVEYLKSTDASAGRCSVIPSSFIPTVHLSSYLEGLISTGSSNKSFQWNSDTLTSDSSNATVMSSFTKSKINVFSESLEQSGDIAGINNTERMQILSIIDLLQEINNPDSSSAYKSLDDPGRRFWVAVKFRQLYFVRRFGKVQSSEELVIDSELVGWAFHSDCQETLFSSLLPSEPSWQEMRSLGVGFWYTNEVQLRVKMEKLARQHYLKTRDPKACALLYIALNRLQVLAGLFKLSKDEKDKLLVVFLSRNFQEEKNKQAALKNAYVLLGRHQLELAIAFFLLGGDVTSAISVCTKNLGDEQLALIICRLVEGYGGPLECHLISKFLLPSAIEKGALYFASYLEWILGNHAQAFLRMMGFKMDSLATNSALLSNHASFLDPSIGQYCLMLASKSSMKNAIGEHAAAILGRWAILMRATALDRCGLPLEALECLSSASGHFGVSDQGPAPDITSNEFLRKMFMSSSDGTSLDWISGDVASHMELHAKLDIAMRYISNIVREHPCWLQRSITPPGACTFSVYIHQDRMLIEHFQHKLLTGIACFEQKFSLVSTHLIDMVVIFLCNNSLLFIAYNILQCYICKYQSLQESHAFESLLPNNILSKLLLKDVGEIPWVFSRYITVSSIISSQLKSCSTGTGWDVENKSVMLAAWDFYVQGFIWSLQGSRAVMKLFSDSCSENFVRISSITLDLCEYYVYFASAWLQRNYKALVLIAKPLLIASNGHASYEISIDNLRKLLTQIAESGISSIDSEDAFQISTIISKVQGKDMMSALPEEERWQITSASLWGHVSSFLQSQLDSLPENVEESYPFCRQSKPYTFVYNFCSSEPDGNTLHRQLGFVSVSFYNFLKIMCIHLFSVHAKQLALFLWLKVENLSSTPSISWLDDFIQSQPRAVHKNYSQHGDGLNNENGSSISEMLLDIFADLKIINRDFAQESSKWVQYIKQKHLIGWNDVYVHITEEHETDYSGHDHRVGSIFSSKGTSSDGYPFTTLGKKDRSLTKKVMPFKTSKEIYKRNGELLEALCINSINQHQAAVSSNRKGIIFFDWEGDPAYEDKSDDIWVEADWPPNGWVDSESTPVPTCVSPGVGLGNKKGSHLGLGGATVGVSSLSFARPGRDLTGGGAFGVPGYAGVGASGLGWEIQEDFEEFVDPPATVENISTRAFSNHPRRPFFLVGSSNTHIYLWEFGKHKATATYGVLPAANVPPPYSLASISAVRFDQCGQRFATAALDGTVCTWQLEVGGRSNVFPTESCLCFNNHASDVTYVTASGSIIATAGYSSNDVNVVIWDTLAPPVTSRASIICHEGGARSLSVFDNDIGSGSISPLIVTGGKGGDVGLHDFRYLATGKTKKHRNFDSSEQLNISTTDVRGRVGEPNANGMLWYIPKAHSGSITKISTIPNTSFILTGSKDGDVKLWDAKRAELVFHWPKLHERHTFLQPSSRGFGTVVRAGVTDIQVVSHGFLTCGGDGSVMLVPLKDSLAGYMSG